MTLRFWAACGVALAASSMAAAAPVSFSGAFSDNFDEMASGTTLPAGWTSFSVAGSHDTYTPPDTAAGHVGVLPSAAMGVGGALTAGAASSVTAATPSTQKGSATYNWATPTTFPGYYSGNRSLGTSPSGIAGMILELALTNDTGGPVDALSVQYDINVFSVTSNGNNYPAPYDGREELPGYWVYYSLDGGASYTLAHDDGHDASTLTTWPNSIRAVNENWSTALSSSWAAGATLKVRFFDDNAQGPSPDELIGLDNLVVTPEPISLLSLGLAGLLLRRRD